MAHRSLQSVVDIRPMTIACRLHSASSFVHSTMTTGCTVRWYQLRIVSHCHWFVWTLAVVGATVSVCARGVFLCHQILFGVQSECWCIYEFV